MLELMIAAWDHEGVSRDRPLDIPEITRSQDHPGHLGRR